jgi:hypothetical protein
LGGQAGVALLARDGQRDEPHTARGGR